MDNFWNRSPYDPSMAPAMGFMNDMNSSKGDFFRNAPGISGAPTGPQANPGFGMVGSGASAPAQPPQMMQGGYVGQGQSFTGSGQPMGAQNPWGGSGGFGSFSASTGNPYLNNQASEIQRRANDSLQQGLSGIRTHAAGMGNLGGSRQGVAEGQAVQGSIDNVSGQLANLFGSQYNADANRGLSLYQGNQQNALGWGGLQNQRYGIDQNAALGWGGLTNQAIGQDQNFYTSQRGQDLQQAGLGATLMQQGLNMPWSPLQNANGIYGNYTGQGTTTTGQQTGGGALGFLGGALGGAQLGKNAGWW